MVKVSQHGLTSLTNFFKYLNKRGLHGTKLVISDSHTGLVSAIRQSFTGVSWQRCQVHFMRNVLTHVSKRDSKAFRKAIKSIFRFTDIELARTAKNELIDQFDSQKRYEKFIYILIKIKSCLSIIFCI